MWVVRESLRLLSRIATAVVIAVVAVVAAELRAIVGDGDMVGTFRVMLLLLGCLMLLLATAGTAVNQQKAHWMANSHGVFVPRSFGLGDALANAGGPTLSPSAVFAGSGIALIAIGVLI
jgi:hypothetical protein